MKAFQNILVLQALFLFFCLDVLAQTNPYNEVSIASPTAGAIAKYGDIPVSYHTGIPQISIPIYSVKEGPLSLPISLSYHAGGLKVLEPASWVGAGWSLSAGGVITRTVQGAPDEKQNSTVSLQDKGHLSDNGYNNYLWVPHSNHSLPNPPTAPKLNNFDTAQDALAFASGQKDGEPDLFFFNFPGYSGKFFFGDDGRPVLVPETDLRIDYSYTPGAQKSIDNFTIVTPEGTKYFFGRTAAVGDTDAVEITNPYSQDNTAIGTLVSSWYLNKISSADDIFNISLKYTPENYSYYTLSMFPLDISAVGQLEYKMIQNVVNGMRLSKIIFSNGKIDFFGSTVRQDLNSGTQGAILVTNTEARALDSIRISDIAGANGKTYVLSYNYFDDNSSPLPSTLASTGITTDKKRLKLNSIQERSIDGTMILPAHQFDYFTDFVPRRINFATDHWGFYNNATGNSTLIPTYTYNEFTTISGANRDANWPAMRGGALKRITYPTGGYSEFDFEANYTWVSFMKKILTFRFNCSAGFDGSSNWVINTQTFSANTYKLTFTNSIQGSQALLNIFRVSDNATMGGWVLEAGQSTTVNLQYGAGNYRLELKKLAPVSGTGAQVTLEEWLPTLIQKNETVGGLRVKTITHNDGVSTSNNQVTTYTYETAGKSTGFLYSRPAYVYKARNDELRDYGYSDLPSCSPQGCVDCNGGTYMKSPCGIRPLATTQGNHIGYNEVQVTQAGNGYSIYRFYGSDRWDTNTEDVAVRNVNAPVCEANLNNYPYAPLPYEFMRGELKYEGHFNESGQAIKTIDYYPVYQNNPIKTPAFIATRYTIGATTYLLETFYEIITARKTQTGMIVNETVPGVGSMQTSSYSYFESAYHNQVTRTSSTSSTGETLETKIKYASDFRITSCDGITNGLTTYNAALSSALTQFVAYPSTCGSSQQCKYWNRQYYLKAVSDARIAFMNTRKANYSNPSNSYLTCLTNAKSAGDSWQKPILDLQLRYRNPTIETSTWRAGKLLSATFNKYDYSTVPANGIYPSKSLAVNITTSSVTFTPASVSGTTISKDSRYIDETLVKFNNGNLVEVTPKSGLTTSYIWGNNNTLPIVKATGVDFATLNAAYTAVSGNLSTLRNQASLSAALVNTYVYNAFVGMTSEMDPRSRYTYYEYDRLQRLSLVRDHDNNILKRICYGYGGTSGECNVFYNIATSGVFTRNNCTGGYTGSQVTYTVPIGTYSSQVSQIEANLFAQNAVNANGQAYANANGTCIPPPVTIQGYNTKTSTYQVKFTNNSDGLWYTFFLNPNTFSLYTLGQIPQGVYKVEFYPAGSPLTATFNINGFTQSGQAATFNNITINANSNAYMY